MSFLAPFFFLAAAAIAAPILFHLIRREPKGRVRFSSLIFVQPSPPRVTRRSRLDNWLLLLLRALAILFVAAAFTRPFLRYLGQTTVVRPTSFTVLLVDRSASMRRDDLWLQAVGKVEQEIAKLGPSDRFAIVAFDREADVISGLQRTSEGDAKSSLAQLAASEPSWFAGNLGEALITAAGLIDETLRAEDEADAVRSVVVIGDMQQSSNVDALRGFRWPESTLVRLEPVAPAKLTNASLFVAANQLEGSEEGAGESKAANVYRVNVSNSERSGETRFSLQWLDALGKPEEAVEESFNVPPGASRVFNVAAPTSAASALQLRGDEQAYDNTFHVVVPQPLEQKIVMIGKQVEDPRDSLYYYFEKLPLGKPGRTVTSELIPADKIVETLRTKPWIPQQVPLVVLAEFPEPQGIELLSKYLSDGGKILVVLDDAVLKDAKTELGLRMLCGDSEIDFAPAAVKDYALLTRVDFASEVFNALADARYNDFSKIQFWKHAALSLSDDLDWEILARFDSGTPALAKRKLGAGQLYVLASGWQPTESQLALSTKFVPMVSGMVGDPDRGKNWESLVLGDPTSLQPSENATITTPEGDEIAFRSLDDLKAIDHPGIYRWSDSESTRLFAVNLPASESDGKILDPAVLEQLGLPFTDAKRKQMMESSERQMRDAELEGQQSLWRWFLLGAMGFVGLETWLSTRRKK